MTKSNVVILVTVALVAVSLSACSRFPSGIESDEINAQQFPAPERDGSDSDSDSDGSGYS